MIDAILEGDSRVPRKQRHTAKRVFERLKDEYGFDGQYTIVKDYVRERGRRTQEMFVPLSHAPGHAQCDFGEAVALIAGVERKVHYFVLDLPHSDGCFVKAYPAETTEAFLDGHVSAFALLDIDTPVVRFAAALDSGWCPAMSSGNPALSTNRVGCSLTTVSSRIPLSAPISQ